MKFFNLVTLVIFFLPAVSFAAGECTEQFSWTPNSEADLGGYKIYYGLDDKGPYPNMVDIGNPDPDPDENRIWGEVSGLECGTTYYFVCRAYNAAGLESDNSEQAVAVAGSNPPPVPPGESVEVTAIFGSVPDADYDGTIEDTFINLNEDNNAANQQLNTYTWPDNMVANAIIMKIDLAQLPKGAQVQSASLQLYATESGGDSEYDISVHKVINYNPILSTATGATYDGTNNWTANTSCYNNVPLAQADIDLKAAESSIDVSVGYKSWNVTGMVKDWLAEPNLNYGLLLNSDAVASSDSYRSFASSEAADLNQRPKLVVTYTVEPMTAIFGSVPDADYDGTIEDTFINLNEENNAANQQLNTYTWPDNMVANAIIMKIDLAQLPKGARVQNASLQLYATESGGDSEYDISVHKIIHHNPILSTATGVTYDGTNDWTANTSCYNNVPLAQADIDLKAAESSIDVSVGYKSWDVTGMVNDWLAEPNLNYGLLLNSDAVASSNSYRSFASSEAAALNQRPKLVVQYTIENVEDMPAPSITNMSQN